MLFSNTFSCALEKMTPGIRKGRLNPAFERFDVFGLLG
jgi:hypothetical protein